MMLAVMYGMIPSAKIDRLQRHAAAEEVGEPRTPVFFGASARQFWTAV